MNKRPLTRDRHDVRHPCWSPAGDRLAFIASHGAGKEEMGQVFILPMNGGEAHRITKSPTAVQPFWRKNQKNQLTSNPSSKWGVTPTNSEAMLDSLWEPGAVLR